MQEDEDKNVNEDDFDLGSFFEKGADNESKPIAQNTKEPVKKTEPIKEDQEKAPDEDKEEVGDKDHKKEDASKEVDYKAELEKAQKAIKDTQKSFHEDRKKLAAYKKAVEKLREEGSLLEEEANLLLDHTKHEDSPEDVPLLTKYFNIWDKEIDDMRRVYEKGYIPKPQEFEQHIMAFQHFIQNAPPGEKQDVLNELSMFEDNHVELTKKMLEMGRQYNDEIYSDINEAGSIKNLKSMYSKKEEKLKKRIDSLEKEVDKLKEENSKGYDKLTKVTPDYSKTGSTRGDVNLDENAPFDIKAFMGR